MNYRIPPAHVHFFKITASENLQHDHLLRLYTFSVNGTAYDKHVHQFQGISGIKYGHYHSYYGTTGPAIALQDGSHFHLLDGTLELNVYNTPRKGALEKSASKEGLLRELHHHSFTGYSSVGFGYEPW